MLLISLTKSRTVCGFLLDWQDYKPNSVPPESGVIIYLGQALLRGSGELLLTDFQDVT